MQGVLAIYKPEKYTSHDVVAIVRRQSGIKKVGHTGTLDPMATGVLIVCIGKATRIIEYLESDEKVYVCTMKLGFATDTLDIWGNIIETADEEKVNGITNEDIESVMSKYRGIIAQVPPKYSALKVNGKKLYEYAREGKDVDIKPRQVNIKSLDLIEFNDGIIKFKVRCSKGTYIRTLCDDIGKDLGTLGVMTSLIRTENGKFSLDDAISIEKIKTMSPVEIQKNLKSIDYPLKMDKIIVDKRSKIDLIDGKKIKFNGDIMDVSRNLPKNNLIDNEKFKIYSEDVFVGVSEYDKGYLKADKIFNTEK